MPSILWNANTCVVPLVKMSYHASYGIGLKDSTPLLDVVNYMGLLVTAAYTVACVAAKPAFEFHLRTGGGGGSVCGLDRYILT